MIKKWSWTPTYVKHNPKAVFSSRTPPKRDHHGYTRGWCILIKSSVVLIVISITLTIQNPFILLVLLLNTKIWSNQFFHSYKILLSNFFFQDHYPWIIEDPFIHFLKVSTSSKLVSCIWTSLWILNGLSNTYFSWVPSLLPCSAHVSSSSKLKYSIDWVIFHYLCILL